jgi:hypothetical protein
LLLKQRNLDHFAHYLAEYCRFDSERISLVTCFSHAATAIIECANIPQLLKPFTRNTDELVQVPVPQ